MVFKKFSDGSEIEMDVIDYVREFLIDNPGCKVSVGTDSKHKKSSKKTVYATAVVIAYPGSDGFNKGAHVIYTSEKVFREISLFERLWNEVERSRELADRFRNEMKLEVEVHVDVNHKKDFDSFMAYKPAIGYLKGLRYTVFAKPHAPAATCAADVIVNNK